MTTMSLFNTLYAGFEIVKDAITPDVTSESARIMKEQEERREAERVEREVRQQADAERILAYLAQPRRTVDEIQASIAAVQTERDTYAARLVDLERKITQDDDPVSPKQATEHSQLILSIKSCEGRLQRLADELADAQRAERLSEAQASIAGYLERGEALLAYERDEFADLEAKYLAAMEKRRQERYWLFQWTADAGLAQIKSADRTLQADIEALKAPHPLCHTTWRQV